MSFQLTTTELAFAVPSGVVGGALIALWGVGRTNKANFKRAHAEKMWDKRSILYVDIINHLRFIDAEMAYLPRGGGGNGNGFTINKMSRSIDALENLETQIDAYASDQVQKLTLEWKTARQAAFDACHDLDRSPNRIENDAAALVKRARGRSEQLKKTMRGELQGR